MKSFILKKKRRFSKKPAKGDTFLTDFWSEKGHSLIIAKKTGGNSLI